MSKEKRFKVTLTKEVSFPYLLHLPENYNKKKVYPLIIFLHGAGERGDDTRLLKVGLPNLLKTAKYHEFILVAPQCPVDSWWTRELDELSLFLKDVLEQYPVDHKRVYLTGLSMGGDGTWRLAAQESKRFAAIVPICGRDKANSASKLKSIPTWAFHGAKDKIVAASESRKVVRAINKLGGRATVTVYPDADHNAWDKAYKTKELYDWLFAQHKR